MTVRIDGLAAWSRPFGIGLLLAAAAISIVLPPGWLALVLGVLAFLILARDPRLGLLPAGMAVMLALPYDRAANNDLLRIADFPVRPHDMIAVLALLLGATTARWRMPRSTMALALGVLLTLGLAGMAVGLAFANDFRDIFRDARWWFLYAAGLAALVWKIPRPAILRGLLLGTVVFAAVAVIAVVLPPFDGGLKDRALTFDRGLLRMQFGNSLFLLPSAALAATIAIRRGSLLAMLTLLLLLTAVMLTFTRTFVPVTMTSVLLAAVWAGMQGKERRRRIGRVLVVAMVAGGATATGMALYFGQSVVADAVGYRAAPNASPVSSPQPGASATTPALPTLVPLVTPMPSSEIVDPMNRFLFRGTKAFSMLFGGRFVSYAHAMAIMAEHPATGAGLGSLVQVNYAFGGEEFDTEGMLPNVDNAYLTVGMKAGVPGIAVLGALLLWPLVVWWHGGLGRLAPWFVPAWLGILMLTMTQSFATLGYGPYGLSLLLALSGLGYAASKEARARFQL